MGIPDLSTAATLDLWQAAERRDPVERSLMLAAAVDGATADRDALARLPLGSRDARLLVLYAALGARALGATAPCPACGSRSEFSVDPDALLARAKEPASHDPVDAAGHVVAWRSPDSRDVAVAAGAGDARAAERVLLARCVIEASGPDGEVDPQALPVAVREALARSMAAADPLAEVLVAVECAGCGGAFVVDLDIADFVWAELSAHAGRLLRDVDTLARAYGWTEDEVLALDDRRRAAYLDLVREGGT